MHTCSKCGKEFDGKFCPECGTKFIDKDACPKCGARIAEGAKYCSECGARVDGKKVCPKCGAEAEGAFCTQCGAKLDGAAKAGKAGGGRSPVAEKVKFALYLSGIICLLLSALTGLIFTFVSGVTIQSNGADGEINMLYYYFGDVFKDIKDIQKALETSFDWKYMGSTREFGLYFPAVIGTAFSAVAMLGVVALCALAGYKAYQRFYKKQEVNVAVPAAGAFLVFATLATVLLALNSAGAEGIRTAFSAPTLAGLIVGGVFCGLGVVLTAASRFEAFRNFDGRVGVIFAFAVAALATVVLALMSLAAGRMEMIYSEDSILGMLIRQPVHIDMGLFGGMNSMILITESDEVISDIITYCSVGGVAGVALAVVSAVVMTRKVSSLCNGGKKGCLILNAANVVLAVLYLTFTILFVNKMIGINSESLSSDVSFGKNFAVPVVALVMTVLALAAELAGRFVHKKPAPAEAE